MVRSFAPTSVRLVASSESTVSLSWTTLVSRVDVKRGSPCESGSRQEGMLASLFWGHMSEEGVRLPSVYVFEQS